MLIIICTFDHHSVVLQNLVEIIFFPGCVKGRKKELKNESAMPSANNTNDHDTDTPVMFTVQKPTTENTIPKPTTSVGLF